MPAGRVFLANVGANASHAPVVSPLYPDGTFDLIPIPEFNSRFKLSCLRYCDLHWNRGLLVHQILGARRWKWHCHNDPDLDNGVYGDLPESSTRAAALRSARPGDLLGFFGRLRPVGARLGSPPAGFYILGSFRIRSVFRPVASVRPPRAQGVSTNPHVRKWVAGSPEMFWLFLGKPGRHTRSIPPVKLTREVLIRLLPKSKSWNWGRGRSDLQTIGSYLRSIRSFQASAVPDLVSVLEGDVDR